MIIFVFILIVFALWNVYMLFRNEAVYRFRVRVLNEDYANYSKLPNYKDMVYKYWYVWDFERFKAENENF